MAKTHHMGVRLTAEQREQLEEIAKATGLKASGLCGAAVDALIAYWEQYRRIEFPIRVTDSNSDSMGYRIREAERDAEPFEHLIRQEKDPAAREKMTAHRAENIRRILQGLDTIPWADSEKKRA